MASVGKKVNPCWTDHEELAEVACAACMNADCVGSALLAGPKDWGADVVRGASVGGPPLVRV